MSRRFLANVLFSPLEFLSFCLLNSFIFNFNAFIERIVHLINVQGDLVGEYDYFVSTLGYKEKFILIVIKNGQDY